jgi:hypothetical protein
VLNLELQKYISAQFAAGIPLDHIKSSLALSGWSEIDIADSIPKESTVATAIPSVEPTMQQPTTNIPGSAVKKGGAGKMMFIALLVIFLLVGGVAGVYAYTTYQQDPMRVFAEMAKRSDVKEYSYDLNMTTESKVSGQSEVMAFSMKSAGDIDMKDEKAPKMSMNLSFSSESEGLSGAAAGQLVVLNDMMYFKVTEIPELGAILGDTSEFMNVWFSYSLTELQKQAGTTTISPTSTITPEQSTQIRDAFVKNECVTLSKHIPSDAVLGVETYHYEYTIVNEKLVPFMKDVAVIMKEEFTDKQVEQFEEALKQIVDMKGEVWIGKQDYLPYKVTFAFGMLSETGDDLGKANIAVSMKNFGNIPEIIAPSDAKSIEELIEKMSVPNSSSTVDMRNIQRSTDVQQLLNAVNTYAQESGHSIADFGTIPLCTATPAKITSASSGIAAVGYVNLAKLLVPKYLVKIPEDPSTGSSTNTGYTICKTATNRIQIAAPGAENGKNIVVIR